MFKKWFVYKLLTPYNDSGAEYVMPVETGDFYSCDCFLVDKDFYWLNGYEFPVVISKEQLGEIVGHCNDFCNY